MPAGSVHHILDLSGVQGHWLLTKDSLALPQAKKGMFGMVAVRSGNIDRIDVRVGRQIFIPRIIPGGFVSSREFPGTAFLPGRYGLQTGVSRQFQGNSKFVGDLSGADNAPFVSRY